MKYLKPTSIASWPALKAPLFPVSIDSPLRFLILSDKHVQFKSNKVRLQT